MAEKVAEPVLKDGELADRQQAALILQDAGDV